ncbi:hypothetical protein [Geminocystis herdmanii]|uniref:hypothetical protein n=1 Tax=Geminocystis herdmanii TaxID=669359 RepID=UPI000346374F|nr:hypothetical protein [Geminocystis herdmanii]
MRLKISNIQKYLEDVNKEIDQENYFSVEGINYLDALNNFHQVLKPTTYIEIGINYGNSLRLAKVKIIISISTDIKS